MKYIAKEGFVFDYDWYRMKYRIPYTMEDLFKCVKKGKCNLLKKNLFTHVSVVFSTET